MVERLSNRIRALRKERGISQVELVELLGGDVPQATVSKLESGRMTLSHAWITRFAAALNVTPAEIIADFPLRLVPIVGDIAAGSFSEAIENVEGQLPIPPQIGGPHCIALRTQGDSINRIANDGDYLVVDLDDRALQHGRLYAFMNGDGEASVKRYCVDPPRLMPDSTNPAHQPLVVGESPFVVLGRVVYVTKVL